MKTWPNHTFTTDRLPFASKPKAEFAGCPTESIVSFKFELIISPSMKMTPDESANEAIKHALKSLRKRQLLEEAAHSPSFTALSKPLVHLGSEWKEKAEKLELQIQQCYKSQAQLSEQLVKEVAESRTSKALVEEKESTIFHLEKEVNQEKDKCSSLKEVLREKSKSLELMLSENQALKQQVQEMIRGAKQFEEENKTLINAWTLLKKQRAREASMVDQRKAGGIEHLAGQQIDGVIRQCEAGSENFAKSIIPTSCTHKISGHEGGCGSIIFKCNSDKLISGGQDSSVKIWDTKTGKLDITFYGCIGSVLDLAVSHDNRLIVAASNSNNLYVWDTGTGQIRHTLKGHTDKVYAVDMSKQSSSLVVSAAYDRTIKIWDLQKGRCVTTIISHSNCNALCFSLDEQTICSGHVDGNLRLWSTQSGKLDREVASHNSHAITSICLSKSGNFLLTSGKGNIHNLFDMRSLEFCGSFEAKGNTQTSNWSRSCISADDEYVAAGSSDGSVYIWSRSRNEIVSTLKEDSSPILSCAWSGLGKPLASASKNGTIYIWS